MDMPLDIKGKYVSKMERSNSMSLIVNNVQF